MCEAFIWYYPKLTLDSCASFYPIEKLYEKFAIKDVEWHVGLEGGPEPFIKSPASMANKTFSQALDENVNWTPEVVADLQKLLVKSDHVSICSGKGPNDNGPPPPPPPGFELERERHHQEHEPVPSGSRHPSSHPPPRELRRGKSDPPPSLPPEMEEMLKVTYPKLVQESNIQQ